MTNDDEVRDRDRDHDQDHARDDDPVMDWALGERLGGEQPRDLVDGVRARLARGPVALEPRHRMRAQLLVAACVLLGIGVVLGVALWSRAPSSDAPAQSPSPTPAQQEPTPAQVYSLADAQKLPASTRAVEAIDADDATIAALKRLRDLEVLVVREPFHENHGLGLKRMPPTDPKHVTAAAWPDLLSFTKLRRLELSGTLLLGRVKPEQIAEGLERLPLLSTLALRCMDTSEDVLRVLPRLRSLQGLDLSYNHGFDASWIDSVVQCRSLVSLRVNGCQQIHGRELARLGELPELEQIDAANIDGINWRNSGGYLDDTERDVIARAQRLSDHLGMGPGDEALEGIAKCKKLRVLDIAGSHCSSAGLAHLGACTDLKVLNAFGGGKDHSFVASLPAGLERLEVCGDYSDAFCTAVAERLTSLRHLNIAACYEITDRGLAKVAAMPSLRILDMRQMRGLTVGSIATLLAAKQLEDLDVRHCDFITADHVVELRRLLPRLQHLETSVDPTAVAEAEKRAPRFPGATKEQIETWVRTGKRAIDGSGFDDECVAALAQSKVIERLVLRSVAPEIVEKFGFLELPDMAITDSAMRVIAGLPTLRALRLERASRVTPEGLALLAHLPVLEELEFVAMEIPDALFAHLVGTPLKRLRLEHCRGFGAAGVASIVQMKELRDVSLTNCNEMIEAWLERLAELPKLERLDLSSIGVYSGRDALEIWSRPWPGPHVTTRVLTALGKSTTLRELDIADIADLGPNTEGLRALQGAPALRSLGLRGVDLHTADLAAMPSQLTRLVLEGIRSVDEGFVTTLTTAVPTLEELTIRHCGGASDQLARLRAMPNLKVLVTDKGREELRK